MPTHEEKAGFAQRHDITTKQVRLFLESSTVLRWKGSRGEGGGGRVSAAAGIQH